jgi:hypothetical protein
MGVNSGEKPPVSEKDEAQRMLDEEEEAKLEQEMKLDENTTCGFWFLRGPFFQR